MVYGDYHQLLAAIAINVSDCRRLDELPQGEDASLAQWPRAVLTHFTGRAYRVDNWLTS
ncbi:Hypothetical protein I596_1232 [Dokdonella koreensis DS-123]|uniref:Uncharacterized protein n=1 Tax=Dokdonella koreensis DS-123 TaxID=1300342 RepID=A0A167GRC7_9GAMM|nr:Hypothetical protein I596_1232 [Dokdonella koreensis DS-123]